MSRATSLSSFLLVSLLLILGQTSALLSAAPRSVSHRTSSSSSSSSLNLCPGEGAKLVEAFNEAIANGSIQGDGDLQSKAEMLQTDLATAVAAAPTQGLLHRLKHALGTVGTAEETTPEMTP